MRNVKVMLVLTELGTCHVMRRCQAGDDEAKSDDDTGCHNKHNIPARVYTARP